jgi:hypothetical protein
MDTLTQYRQYIQQILSSHAQQVWDHRIQAEMIIDQERDHYQLLYVGWRDSKRVFGVVIHIDIIDRKIWIQQDGTEIGVANELLELGVSKLKIFAGKTPCAVSSTGSVRSLVTGDCSAKQRRTRRSSVGGSNPKFRSLAKICVHRSPRGGVKPRSRVIGCLNASRRPANPDNG